MKGPQMDEMFERLLVLRHWYPLRSDYDRRPVMSLAATLDYGEWRMRLARVAALRHGRRMARPGT